MESVSFLVFLVLFVLIVIYVYSEYFAIPPHERQYDLGDTNDPERNSYERKRRVK